MTPRLSQTVWYQQPAWQIETDRLSLITVPGMGAKIVSVYDKTARYEWLRPPGNRPFVPLTYGASFTAQDMSGWDEMFPTIDSCAYPPQGRHAGTSLPDHGEVWALPWAIEPTMEPSLSLSVRGRALPYRLSRTIAFTETDTVQFHYNVQNDADEPLSMLWAAHPQFVADDDTLIVLPEHIQRMVNVQSTSELSNVGVSYPWSRSSNRDERLITFEGVASLQQGEYRKLYVAPDQSASWVMLEQRDRQARLSLSWRPEELPYLGIWYDKGAFNTNSTIALEPTNGYFDDLSRAWRAGRCMMVPPFGMTHWTLALTVG